jgi:hypothetical protein
MQLASVSIHIAELEWQGKTYGEADEAEISHGFFGHGINC